MVNCSLEKNKNVKVLNLNSVNNNNSINNNNNDKNCGTSFFDKNQSILGLENNKIDNKNTSIEYSNLVSPSSVFSQL